MYVRGIDTKESLKGVSLDCSLGGDDVSPRFLFEAVQYSDVDTISIVVTFSIYHIKIEPWDDIHPRRRLCGDVAI